MRRARLYLHALTAARPRQLAGRATRPVRRRRFRSTPAPPFAPPERARELWQSEAWEPARLAGSGTRLHAFHEQYGDDVLRAARAGDGAGARAAAEAWIRAHPPRPGDAWHPYTASTRVAAWIAAAGLAPEVASRDVVQSLWEQALFVAANVEDDILGNHVIRNARALVLAGTAFGSPELLERGLALLARELPEQILPDGGHYERSPVYHLVVLRDLLEVERAVPGAVGEARLDAMRRFAAALARPDGAPALFNDGGLDLAPRLELPPPPDGLALFPETGYAVIRAGGVWLAFDCGPPSPPYLPAHAHADALSFQLWVDGRPLVVDPGMPTYEAGAERDWFRGTRAHSTVAVGGLDQFESWGAFRSGPLPRVELEAVGPARLVAHVHGGGGRHRRSLELLGGALVVGDEVAARGPSESSLPLAPGAEIEASALGVEARREERVVAERLGTRARSSALVARGERELGWTIGLR